MRNRSSLALMEQLIMLTVFALAAALCLKIFALSGSVSKNMEIRDRAVTAVQNAAETIKIAEGDLTQHTELCGGNVTGGVWKNYYDAAGNMTDPKDAAFCVTVFVTENPGEHLGTAEVIAESDEKEIFSLTVAWQEDAS